MNTQRSELLASKLKSFVLMGVGEFSYQEIEEYSLAELEMFRSCLGEFARESLEDLPAVEMEYLSSVLVDVSAEMDSRLMDPLRCPLSV